MTVTLNISFSKEIDENINLRAITENPAIQRKQFFVAITDERHLSLAKHFLNTNNRDFDILQESLGKILDKKLK